MDEPRTWVVYDPVTYIDSARDAPSTVLSAEGPPVRGSTIVVEAAPVAQVIRGLFARLGEQVGASEGQAIEDRAERLLRLLEGPRS